LSGSLVVVDASVVIAHLTPLSVSTPSGRIMHACGAGPLRVALSDAYLRELFEVVTRPNVESQIKSASRAFVTATDLWIHGTLYHPMRIDWLTVVDLEDHWVLDLAWAAEADFIITLDSHLTQPTMPFPVEVVEPVDLLARLPGI
jgi:predicted nucleic acid-binding protein